MAEQAPATRTYICVYMYIYVNMDVIYCYLYKYLLNQSATFATFPSHSNLGLAHTFEKYNSGSPTVTADTK